MLHSPLGGTAFALFCTCLSAALPPPAPRPPLPPGAHCEDMADAFTGPPEALGLGTSCEDVITGVWQRVAENICALTKAELIANVESISGLSYEPQIDDGDYVFRMCRKMLSSGHRGPWPNEVALLHRTPFALRVSQVPVELR